MAETIYTIPINEAFDKAEDSERPICPFCELYEMLEKNALETTMGAAMMEPDIRIETNKHGFAADISTEYMKEATAWAWRLFSKAILPR